VGLVARVVEQAGIPTVTVSTARDLSLQVMAPRTAFVNHPMGNTFGRKGDAETQRQILLDALHMLRDCTTPGTLIDLNSQWHESFAFKPKKRDASYQSGD
jgi:D-proline reductase (dithiol) PrdB